MGVDGTKFAMIDGDAYTDKILATAKEGVSRLRPRTTSYKIKRSVRSILKKPAVPRDNLERELIMKYCTIDNTVKSLEGQVIVEISDCGGQPQFLEILPRFLENIDFSILVTNLNQKFDDYPTNYYYREGRAVGKGVPSPLTNEQVIRLCLQMIASQSQGGRKVKFAFVGTHRDLEGLCIHEDDDGKCKHKAGECSESREIKNTKVKEMIESFGLSSGVISKSHQEFIFAINAKTPEAVDHQMIEQMRQSILEECLPRTISIPVSYHAVELTLKRISKELGHIAFSKSAVLSQVLKYHFTDDSFKDALRYLHMKKRIFYYEQDFPGRVIGEPQAILNKQTEIVAYNIELSSNPERQGKLDRKQWRFVKYGFLTISCLKQFPDHYVEGVFTPVDMMKLFTKLLMVSQVRDGEFLMPCVLPTDQLTGYTPEPNTQSVPPMVLHFTKGPARYGVFCGTICYVMTKSNWKLLMNPDEPDVPFHITRNSVHFSLPGYRCKVTINDPFDSFFVVTLHVPNDVPSYTKTVSCLCAKVRTTLMEAITEVTKKLNYNPDTPTVAFLCREHEDLHPSAVSDVGDELLCTKVSNTRGGELTERYKFWLEGMCNSLKIHLHSLVYINT